jgi:hypothetical protein
MEHINLHLFREREREREPRNLRCNILTNLTILFQLCFIRLLNKTITTVRKQLRLSKFNNNEQYKDITNKNV